jgi:DNA polymerase-1
MSESTNILLIDGNSIGYTHHHATKLSSGGMETQAVFGFVKTIRELRLTYPNAVPIVLWDGRAQWRFDLYPDYKSNRDSDPKKVASKEAYVAQRPYISRALSSLGVRQVTGAKHEADDLAGHFAKQLCPPGKGVELVLISGDQDWIQLLRPGVSWRDMRDDSRIVNLSNLFDKTGYASPFSFLEGKCLQGDGSDYISGVGGIGKDTAPTFIAEHGSVSKFWRSCDDGSFKPTTRAQVSLWKGESPLSRNDWAATYTGDGTDKKEFEKHMKRWPGQGRAIFRRNFRLMQLLKVDAPKKQDLNVDPGKFNREVFREVCEELSFTTILKSIDNFVRPFQK